MEHDIGPITYRSSVPFGNEPLEAAVVCCSDGRFGAAFDEFAASSLGLSRYDRFIVPGGAACLGGHLDARREEEAALRQLRFLIEGHSLEQVILLAHEDCAFYNDHLRISKLRLDVVQREDLEKAAARVQEMRSSLIVRTYFAHIVDGVIVFAEGTWGLEGLRD
jgi:hypothetical protein